MKCGYGIVIFPTSWHVGYWPRARKDIWALGPLRFVRYRARGEWKDGRK